ncbi:MAG: single-stranded DNA-binding protein [Phycisphaeraceae bacterium]|nr:MAG: single-stranded DNA-binding protein [Phycisphaeraceae bacterium]
MPNLNRVFLMGNLTRDVELKYTQSNQAVANLGLAVNRRWRTPEGEEREEVTFIDCEVWGKQAETMAKYLAKGRPVFIEGRLKLDQWEKEGQKFSKLRVVVESFQFVDSKPGGGGGGGSDEGGYVQTRPVSKPAARPAQGSGGAAGHTPVGDDDIPF